MLERPVQPRKEPVPVEERDVGSVTLERLVQDWKVFDIDVTLVGRTMLDRAEQDRNAYCPRLERDVGKSMLVRLVQVE